MRRIVVILALLAASHAAGPVAAHSCASPAVVEVGRPVVVNVGVAAETSAVVGVDVTIPSGFQLDRALDTPGWQIERTPTMVRFTGGHLSPFGCGTFRLAGIVPRKATLAFPVVTHAPDGTTTRYESTESTDLYAAQMVYAGTQPEGSSGDSDEAGGAGLVWAGWMLVGAAAAGAAVFFVRRRLAP